MNGINARARQRVRRLIPLALLVLVACFGAAGRAPATDAAQVGTILVQKVLVDANGQQVAGDLSNFIFTLSGGGLNQQLPPTNAQGQTTVGVAPGTYTLTEQPRPGTTFQGFFIGGVPVLSFPVSAGQTTQITARNLVAGTASLLVQKQLVDPNNPAIILQGQDLSGHSVTVTGPGGFTQTAQTPFSGQLQFTNLAPGTYTVTETPRAGFSFVQMIVNNVPGQQNGAQVIVTGSGQAAVIIQNRPGAAATGIVSVTKQVVDASGAQIVAERAGHSVTIACGAAYTQTLMTDANGLANFTNVPAGTCTVSETPRSGFTLDAIFVGGSTTNIGNNGSFTVIAGQTTNLTIRNRTGGTGTATVTIQKQLVDAAGNQVQGNLADFQFTITCGGITSPSLTTNAAGQASIQNVPAGTCTVTELSRPGFELVAIFVGGSLTNIGNNGAFTVTANQPITLTVRNRSVGSATENVQLFTGCNNVALTWPTGTATATVAGAITPQNILVAIWRFDAASQRFLGYSPIPGAPNDLTVVSRLDSVFICTNGAGTLARPATG